MKSEAEQELHNLSQKATLTKERIDRLIEQRENQQVQANKLLEQVAHFEQLSQRYEQAMKARQTAVELERTEFDKLNLYVPVPPHRKSLIRLISLVDRVDN